MYKAGDCFVIEIGKVIEEGAGYQTNANIIVNDEFFDKLDKLDSDYINEYYGHLQDEAYNKGLEDAWKLANKLWHNNNISNKRIFGYEFFVEVASNLTVQEALAKLEAYEKEQEMIKVGDVVTIESMGGKGVVTSTGANDGLYILRDTGGWIYLDKFSVKKTGKHIDISSILEQIGNEKE